MNTLSAAAAQQASSSRSDSKSYLDLEVPIRDVTYMAGIVRDLAYELLDVETRKKPDSDVIIRMSIRQHEQLFFAIEDVLDRAQDLEKLDHASDRSRREQGDKGRLSGRPFCLRRRARGFLDAR
jgi:hypothetical protein